MVSRAIRKKQKEVRRWSERRYEKHLRHNKLYAKPGIHEFVIVLDNLKPTFNIGKIFRSAEAFGAREIRLIGTEFFDAKSAKGSFKWVPAIFHKSFEEAYQELRSEDYAMYVFEPDAKLSLHRAELPSRSVFIFGHEEFGISFDRSEYPEIRPVAIDQVGGVESLNVSVAASVAMYDYFIRHQ